MCHQACIIVLLRNTFMKTISPCNRLIIILHEQQDKTKQNHTPLNILESDAKPIRIHSRHTLLWKKGIKRLYLPNFNGIFGSSFPLCMNFVHGLYLFQLHWPTPPAPKFLTPPLLYGLPSFTKWLIAKCQPFLVTGTLRLIPGDWLHL